MRGDERLAWLIIGQEIAGRVHAFVFDGFSGDDEEPCPQGLYRIRRSYARLLVQATGPLPDAPPEWPPGNKEAVADETLSRNSAATTGVGSEQTPPADPETG